jgi:hypothetical protein
VTASRERDPGRPGKAGIEEITPRGLLQASTNSTSWSRDGLRRDDRLNRIDISGRAAEAAREVAIRQGLPRHPSAGFQHVHHHRTGRPPSCHGRLSSGTWTGSPTRSTTCAAGYETIKRLSGRGRLVNHVNEVRRARCSPPVHNSWYLGANIEGNPHLHALRRWRGRYAARCREIVANGYEGFALGVLNAKTSAQRRHPTYHRKVVVRSACSNRRITISASSLTTCQAVILDGQPIAVNAR